MRSLLFTAALTVLLAFTLTCQNTGIGGSSGSSPTDAYKQLFAAVKSKDTERIKSMMSKKSQEFAAMVAGRQSQPVEKVYENGFTATTFAESVPEIRDERIEGDYGAIEVWNAKDKRWEDLGFVKEDGAWKLAVGDMFGGTFKSPGKGRAIKEQEAANAMSNTMIQGGPSNTNLNTNTNIPIIVPKERPQTNGK